MSYGTALQANSMNFRYDDAIKFLNNFTNAEYKGEWWDTRQGDYRLFKEKDSDHVLRVLCNMTGLSAFRYKPCCRRKRDADS